MSRVCCGARARRRGWGRRGRICRARPRRRRCRGAEAEADARGHLMRGVVAVPLEVVVREDLRPLRGRVSEADARNGALAREPGALDAEAAAGVGGKGAGDLLLLVQELVLPG